MMNATTKSRNQHISSGQLLLIFLVRHPALWSLGMCLISFQKRTLGILRWDENILFTPCNQSRLMSDANLRSVNTVRNKKSSGFQRFLPICLSVIKMTFSPLPKHMFRFVKQSEQRISSTRVSPYTHFFSANQCLKIKWNHLMDDRGVWPRQWVKAYFKKKLCSRLENGI